MQYMRNPITKSVISLIAAVLIWTLLFFQDSLLKEQLPTIHLIFLSTLSAYLLIKFLFSDILLDFIKVFIRTLFRVWLLIFITFAITRSTDRVGVLLSITFIFGYFEGLLDVDKWTSNNRSAFGRIGFQQLSQKKQQAFCVLMLMSWIHILCGIVVKLVAVFFGSFI